MKRTAADFANDARDGEVYELELADGTVTTPRSIHDVSYDEFVAQQANEVRWYRWHREHPDEFSGDEVEVDGVKTVSPDEFVFRLRFGDQYDAWWAEWRKMPRRAITALTSEIDAFYDPTPASDQEKTAATAGDEDATGKSSGVAAS